MTSNLGAEHLLSGLTGIMSMKTAKEKVMEEVRMHFRPDLLNRLDEIVVFEPLAHEQLLKVESAPFLTELRKTADRLTVRLVPSPTFLLKFLTRSSTR